MRYAFAIIGFLLALVIADKAVIKLTFRDMIRLFIAVTVWSFSWELMFA